MGPPEEGEGGLRLLTWSGIRGSGRAGEGSMVRGRQQGLQAGNSRSAGPLRCFIATRGCSWRSGCLCQAGSQRPGQLLLTGIKGCLDQLLAPLHECLLVSVSRTLPLTSSSCQ